MLWLKALHVVFMVTWFAGLFYLPRLFVYHVSVTDAISRDRFVTMERRLFAIMTIGAALTLAFGLAMIWQAPAYLDLDWMRIKLVLVAVLIAYHVWCYRLMHELASGSSGFTVVSARRNASIEAMMIATPTAPMNQPS